MPLLPMLKSMRNKQWASSIILAEMPGEIGMMEQIGRPRLMSEIIFEMRTSLLTSWRRFFELASSREEQISSSSFCGLTGQSSLEMNKDTDERKNGNKRLMGDEMTSAPTVGQTRLTRSISVLVSISVLTSVSRDTIALGLIHVEETIVWVDKSLESILGRCKFRWIYGESEFPV
jgi:hypothetical protein